MRRRRAGNGDDRGAAQLDIATRIAPAKKGGLSTERLKRLHDVLASHVESGAVPGLVALVSRKGTVHLDAIGSLSIGGPPLPRDDDPRRGGQAAAR